jgi:hypothetical protein
MSRQSKLRNKFCRGALNIAPSRRTAKGPPCHRCPACASFPPVRPRASAAHQHARARDPGLSFRFSPANSSNKPCFGKQKTLRSIWLGRVRRLYELSISLCEIAPMSRACITDWLKAIRQSDEFFVPVLHHTTHVRSRTPYSRSAREIRPVISNVNTRIAIKTQQIEAETGSYETAWQGRSFESSMDHQPVFGIRVFPVGAGSSPHLQRKTRAASLPRCQIKDVAPEWCLSSLRCARFFRTVVLTFARDWFARGGDRFDPVSLAGATPASRAAYASSVASR